jgi:ribosomal protein S27AE
MAFDYAALMADLFPEQSPPRALGEPEEARQPPAPALSPPAPVRPVNRLPGALPSPPLSEWLSRWKRAPEVTLPPKPCWWCGRAVFWLSTLGAYRCGRCHPPAYPGLAAMWLRVVPTEDGPQVVRLGKPPSKE